MTSASAQRNVILTSFFYFDVKHQHNYKLGGWVIGKVEKAKLLEIFVPIVFPMVFYVKKLREIFFAKKYFP